MFGINRHDQVTSGIGSYENTEGGRNATNFLRYGVVKEADYPKGLIKVVIQEADIKSIWMPWLEIRSGYDRTWWAPEVGERVLVLAPSGELHDGVALRAQISSASPQICDVEHIERTRPYDQSNWEYDRKKSWKVQDNAFPLPNGGSQPLNYILSESVVLQSRTGSVHINPGPSQGADWWAGGVPYQRPPWVEPPMDVPEESEDDA